MAKPRKIKIKKPKSQQAPPPAPQKKKKIEELPWWEQPERLELEELPDVTVAEATYSDELKALEYDLSAVTMITIHKGDKLITTSRPTLESGGLWTLGELTVKNIMTANLKIPGPGEPDTVTLTNEQGQEYICVLEGIPYLSLDRQAPGTHVLYLKNPKHKEAYEKARKTQQIIGIKRTPLTWDRNKE